MNLDEMKARIKELGISSRAYSIDDSIGTDKYIFRHVHNYWECYYMDERGGQENDYHKFTNENDACLYFLKMLK